jgi:hypothetical protein
MALTFVLMTMVLPGPWRYFEKSKSAMLIVTLLSVHFGGCCLVILALVSGREYCRITSFEVVKIVKPSAIVPRILRLNHMFFLVRVKEKCRILSGFFATVPRCFIIYPPWFKSSHEKAKTSSSLREGSACANLDFPDVVSFQPDVGVITLYERDLIRKIRTVI